VAELDEEYLWRMEDVLALYEKPWSEKEPVVCIDEKPVVLHADLRPPRPMRPGRITRRDCEYERCGTPNAFCGVEPQAGRHFTRATPDRSSPEFADYLLDIAEHYSGADSSLLRAYKHSRGLEAINTTRDGCKRTEMWTQPEKDHCIQPVRRWFAQRTEPATPGRGMSNPAQYCHCECRILLGVVS
jgi:hypothetical protein